MAYEDMTEEEKLALLQMIQQQQGGIGGGMEGMGQGMQPDSGFGRKLGLGALSFLDMLTAGVALKTTPEDVGIVPFMSEYGQPRTSGEETARTIGSLAGLVSPFMMNEGFLKFAPMALGRTAYQAGKAAKTVEGQKIIAELEKKLAETKGFGRVKATLGEFGESGEIRKLAALKKAGKLGKEMPKGKSLSEVVFGKWGKTLKGKKEGGEIPKVTEEFLTKRQVELKPLIEKHGGSEEALIDAVVEKMKSSKLPKGLNKYTNENFSESQKDFLKEVTRDRLYSQSKYSKFSSIDDIVGQVEYHMNQMKGKTTGWYKLHAYDEKDLKEQIAYLSKSRSERLTKASKPPAKPVGEGGEVKPPDKPGETIEVPPEQQASTERRVSIEAKLKEKGLEINKDNRGTLLELLKTDKSDDEIIAELLEKLGLKKKVTQ